MPLSKCQGSATYIYMTDNTGKALHKTLWKNKKALQAQNEGMSLDQAVNAVELYANRLEQGGTAIFTSTQQCPAQHTLRTQQLQLIANITSCTAFWST